MSKYCMPVNKVKYRNLPTIFLGVMLSEDAFAVTEAQATADYLVGSGLVASSNRLGQVASGVAIVTGLILVIWAIISALRAWGSDDGDSFDLLMTVIRGGVLTLGIVIVLGVIN